MTDEVALSTCTEQINDLIRQQRNDEAITLCKHVLRYYPKHVVTYRQMAEASLEKGDLNSALELFRRVLGADPENILAYAGLAVVFEQQHLVAEAAWQLERAYELNPADFEIRKELLRLYADVEGKPRARLKLTPGGLARLYLQQGLLSQAIQELSALAPNSDGRYDVRVGLIQALWQAGRPREAAEGAQSLLECLPFCLKANLILGAVWSESGLEESGTYLQRAQALDPTNEIAQETLGTRSPLSPANPSLPKYVEGAPEFSPAPAPAATSPAEPDWLGTLKPPDRPAVETPAPVSTGEEWLSEKPAAAPIPLQLTSGAPPAAEAAPEAAAEAAPEEPLPADRAIEAQPVPEAPASQAPSESVPAETAAPAPTVSETEAQPSEPAQRPTAAGQVPEWLRGEPALLPAPAEHVEQPPVEMTRPAWLANLIQAQQEALENAPAEDQPGTAEPAEAPDQSATPSWLGPAAMATEEGRVTEERPETPRWLREFAAAPAEETREAAEETLAPAEAAPAQATRGESTPAPSAAIESVPAKPAGPVPSAAAPAPIEPKASEPEDLPDWLKKLRAEFEANQASLETEEPAVSKAPPPVKAPPPAVVSPRVEVPPPAEAPSRAGIPAPVDASSSVAQPPQAAEPAPTPPAEPKVEPKAAEPAAAPPAPAPEEPSWLVQMRAELGGGQAAQPPQAERAASQAQAAPPPSEPTAPARQEPAALLPAAPAHEIPAAGRGATSALPVAETLPKAQAEPPAPHPAAPTEAVPPQPPASHAAEQPPDTQSILVRREAVALIRLDQARSYRDKKRLGEALDEYNYIVQQAPQFVADVIHDLEEIIGEPGAPLQAHRILGDAYTRANRLPEALERYRFVLDHVS